MSLFATSGPPTYYNLTLPLVKFLSSVHFRNTVLLENHFRLLLPERPLPWCSRFSGSPFIWVTQGSCRSAGHTEYTSLIVPLPTFYPSLSIVLRSSPSLNFREHSWSLQWVSLYRR